MTDSEGLGTEVSVRRKRSREEGSSGNVTADGDCVILYGGFQSLTWIKLEAGKETSHRYGVFHHDDMIGVEYGSAVNPRTEQTSRMKKKMRADLVHNKSRAIQVSTGGAVNVLPLTPELWVRVLQHRTQITFALDNQLVVSRLHLRPGMVVCETGTGSGGLTQFLARAVGEKGQVHTFEFNKTRYEESAKDLAKLGMSEFVYSYHADIYSEGFGKALDGKADAVFLDLPSPWLAIKHALRALKPFGRLCSFSPCMEQVQRTTELMSLLGCSHLETITVLLREQRTGATKVMNPGAFKSAAERVLDMTSKPETAASEASEAGSRPRIISMGDLGDVDEELYSAARVDDGEESFVRHSSKASPAILLPSGCKMPLSTKVDVGYLNYPTAFDRHAGHTGYLTFGYAPLD